MGNFLSTIPHGKAITTSFGSSYIGSPSIIKTITGRLIASHDIFSSGTGNTSYIYKSDNGGKKWDFVQSITNVFWGRLFKVGSDLYILGTFQINGTITISKSTDDGDTWSAASVIVSVPVSPATNIGFTCAPCSIAMKGRHVFRAFSLRDSALGSFSSFQKAVFIMGDMDADLTLAASWTLSNAVTFNSANIPATIVGTGTANLRPVSGATSSKGWLEGNIVLKFDGSLVNFLRFTQNPSSNHAVYLNVNYDAGDPSASTLSATHNFTYMNGGNLKFTIVTDYVSGKYWTVANVNRNRWFNDCRTEAFLMSSDDLITWKTHAKVLGFELNDWEADIDQLGVQYSDIIIDGNDLLAVTRTADGVSDSFHNANNLTFTRIKNFRKSPLLGTDSTCSLSIDANSDTLISSGKVNVVRDKSNRFNDIFALQSESATAPTFDGGLIFGGAHRARVVHHESLLAVNGFTVICRLILTTTTGRLMQKGDGSGTALDDYWFAPNTGLSVGGAYSVYTDNSADEDLTLSGAYDSANKRLYQYKNGVARGAPDSSFNGSYGSGYLSMSVTPTFNLDDLWIGDRNHTPSSFLNAKIVALRIVPSFLSATEIKAISTLMKAI